MGRPAAIWEIKESATREAFEETAARTEGCAWTNQSLPSRANCVVISESTVRLFLAKSGITRVSAIRRDPREEEEEEEGRYLVSGNGDALTSSSRLRFFSRLDWRFSRRCESYLRKYCVNEIITTL